MNSRSSLKALMVQNWLAFLTTLCAALTIFGLLAVAGLLVVKGVSHFWTKPVAHVQYVKNGKVHQDFGYLLQYAADSEGQNRLWLQRDAFQYARPEKQIILDKANVLAVSFPITVHEFELTDGRNLLAKPEAVLVAGERFDWQKYTEYQQEVSALLKTKRQLLLGKMAKVHHLMSETETRNNTPATTDSQTAGQEYENARLKLSVLEEKIAQYHVQLRNANGHSLTLPLHKIVRFKAPNQLTFIDKIKELLSSIWYFLSHSAQGTHAPGGVFPAIFGTVLMVLLMTVIVAPLGIVAAIYLTEYAPNNTVIMIIRIAVANLAGVPSVVYGVFGLGFFVYQVGGNIDALFYADKLPTATFGSPGLLWASLTMALLTLPVVIVATEEGLRRVPNGLRRASYALGATKWETIRKVVLPGASSSLMTGIILAIARGAGEVAPMLLVGAVKYAPVLPVDGEFPYIHLERQFMHLGVMIYDGAFHGQVIQDGSTMMFAVSLLLLLVVSLLNMVAILIRNRLHNLYRAARYA